MLDLKIIRPIINGNCGELEVLVRNSDPRQLDLQEVAVNCSFDGAPDLMEVTPPPEQGYFLRTLPFGGEPQAVRFCLRPVKAEVGKHYAATVEVSQIGEEGQREVHERGTITVFLEPRAEVYFAIGVADTIRRVGLGFYRQMVTAGRDAHREVGTVLPEFARGEDPTRTLMSEETFQWAMSMVELGTRIYNSQTRK